MPANHSSPIVHYWAGKYPGKVGWLVGPASYSKTKFQDWMPFACDNDAFSAWASGQPWDEATFFKMLDKCRKQEQQPRWVLVPDVVADKDKTIENWFRYSPQVAAHGWPIAFAVQDGMTADDVPSNADVVFVGGTTEWKWGMVRHFCQNCPRVHVGRVNTLDRVWTCHDLGAESVDGTGWFRDGVDAWRLKKLEDYFEGKRNLELALGI